MAPSRIIVTGSRGLIGSAICEHLSGRGIEVLELDLALGHDLTDELFVRQWFTKNLADGLVNMFALNDHVTTGTRNQSLMSVSLESFRNFLDVNVTTLFSVCREFMRANECGSIVNATSIYGRTSPRPSLYDGGEKHIGYGVSKSAVIMLTQHLAVHCGPSFRVNCVLLGGVQNDQPQSFLNRYSSLTPLGRMARPEECAPLVELLLSSEANYITGALLPVDGGWSA